MGARTSSNNSLWVGTALAVLVLVGVLYWWRDDIGRWLTTATIQVSDEPAQVEERPVLDQPETSGPQDDLDVRPEPILPVPSEEADPPAERQAD